MTTFSRQFVAIFWLVLAPGVAAPGQDAAKPEPAASTRPSRSELRDKQLDVSLEARDIERVLSKLKRASELSKTRITEAAKAAESVSMALDKGDSKGARGEAQQAREMFKEIIKQLEALLAEETPQQVAAARNLANQLAKMERQFTQKFPGAMNQTQAGGKGKMDPKSQVKPQNRGQGSGSGGNAKQPKKQTGEEGQGGGGKKKEKERDGAQEPMQGDGATDPKQEPRDGQGARGKKKEKDGNDAQDPPEKKEGGGAADPRQEPGDGQGAGGKKNGKDGDDDQGPPEKKDGGGAADPKQEPRDGQGAGGKKKEKDGDDVKDPMTGGGGDEDEQDKNKVDRASAESGARDEEPMTEEEGRESLARRAEQLAKTGETLKDILQAISQSNNPADKDAVAKLEAILKETELLKAIEAMPEEADLIRSDKFDDARLASIDLADRLEITAQRLDAAYRAIVAPQAEELRKLEQALAVLREKLENLETQAQVAAWHREAQDLLDQAEKLGISDKAREDFLEEMKKAGLGVNGARNTFKWGLVSDRYTAPDTYATNLIRVQEEVQDRIQNLLLGDISSATDDATPPKYQDLVERYYQVLSKEGAKPEARNPKPAIRSPKIENRNPK